MPQHSLAYESNKTFLLQIIAYTGQHFAAHTGYVEERTTGITVQTGGLLGKGTLWILKPSVDWL